MGDKYCMSFFRHNVIDLMSFCTILLTAGLINPPNLTLGGIATYLGFPDDPNLHDASVDIDLTRKCFCKIYNGKMYFLRFHTFELPTESSYFI